MGDERKRGGDGAQGGNGTSRWEWVAAAAAAVLVFGAIGFLLYEATARPTTPPAVTIEVDSVVARAGGFLVEFRARNHGGSTAAGLTVEGALMRDTVAVETSTATIDYLPPNTARGGGLFFTKDPAAYRLELRPMGFDRP